MNAAVAKVSLYKMHMQATDFVARYSKSSCTSSTFRLLRSVRLVINLA